jgi:hypothetical protein
VFSLQRRSAARVCAALALAVATGSALSACSNSPAGPVESFAARGEPVVNVAGTAVTPGQPAVVTAFVTNKGQPVTLISASPVAVPGYRPATLTDIGVDKTPNVMGIGYGWPPDHIPVRSLNGAVLPHGESRILFGITGPSPGANYAAAGVRITYRYRGLTYTVTAWSGAMACVEDSSGRDAANQRCNTMSGKFSAAVDHVAGLPEGD